MVPRRLIRMTALALLVVAIARWLPSFRPFVLLLSLADRLPPRARSHAVKALLKLQYDTLSRTMRDPDAGFLNYGYAPVDGARTTLELAPENERDRYSMQLYDRVAGAVELRGRDVLEVGCGRGGGAAFLFERHAPATMTGLDLSEIAVAHCQTRYGRSGLRFVAGDAEQLPFPDASFDAVVNVESSHCYPNMTRFLTEVTRVLRPGGVLLFADIRSTRLDDTDDQAATDIAGFLDQVAAAGLTVIEEEDVTANVVRALDLDSPRRRAEIERGAGLFNSQLLEFAGVEGSAIHRALSSREVTYLRMVLRPVRDLAAPLAA